MIGTVNGHAWALTKAPAQAQANAYLLWALIRELRRVDAARPLRRFAIDRVGAAPTRYRVTVAYADGADWTMDVVFDDPLDPLFATTLAPTRWSTVVAGRGLRRLVVDLLVEHPGLIDTLEVTP